MLIVDVGLRGNIIMKYSSLNTSAGQTLSVRVNGKQPTTKSSRWNLTKP